MTNDKSEPEFKLKVSGNVKPGAYMSSDVIRLTGNFGDEIKQVVTVSPSHENPFKITDVKAEKGKNIRFELIEIKQEDGINYKLTVYNIKKEKGWYLDKILIKTDSQKSPELIIKVFGVIRR